MNDHIRQLFEDRYRSTFSIYNESPFERTSRGVYASDAIQNIWEGFYAFYEIFKRENLESNVDLADLKIKYLLLKSENKKLVEKNKTDSLLKVVNELREALKFTPLHACQTGDCDHSFQQSCTKTFQEYVDDSLTKADQMLKDMGINKENKNE